MGAVPDMVGVGGVELRYDNDADDQYSGPGADRGCHTVDGTTALQFSRMRYQDPEAISARTKRQRQVISKVILPSTSLIPRRPCVERAGSKSFTVDEDSSVHGRVVVWALRSASSNQMMVPNIESLNSQRTREHPLSCCAIRPPTTSSPLRAGQDDVGPQPGRRGSKSAW